MIAFGWFTGGFSVGQENTCCQTFFLVFFCRRNVFQRVIEVVPQFGDVFVKM